MNTSTQIVYKQLKSDEYKQNWGWGEEKRKIKMRKTARHMHNSNLFKFKFVRTEQLLSFQLNWWHTNTQTFTTPATNVYYTYNIHKYIYLCTKIQSNVDNILYHVFVYTFFHDFSFICRDFCCCCYLCSSGFLFVRLF